MKKIIVPVDFSTTASNAARYAVQLAQDITGASVTLYYAFEKNLAGSDGTPLLNEAEARKDIALVALNNLKNELAGSGLLQIDIIAEEGSLTDKLDEYVKHHHVDLIVMGMNGSSKLDQILIGSNTLSVINKDICPVLIIPAEARYHTISSVVFATDLIDVEETTPMNTLRDFLDTLHPELFVVNVVTDRAAVPDSSKIEKDKLNKMLEAYQPQSFFLLEENFAEAISQFAEQYKTTLIITVPRKHSFLDKLFTFSHTKKLAYHSHLPVLAIHSWGK